MLHGYMYNNILHERLHTCTIILNIINYTLDYERLTLTIILTVTVQVKVSVPVSVALIVNVTANLKVITMLINHQTTRQSTLKI